MFRDVLVALNRLMGKGIRTFTSPERVIISALNLRIFRLLSRHGHSDLIRPRVLQP